jgi:hypothetical protein
MRATTSTLRRAIQWLSVLLLLAASASASAQNCTFRGPAPAAILFPTLDPSNATVVTAFTDVEIRCTGSGVPPPSSWTFVGLYGTNPNLRIKHATLADFIAYSVGNPPALLSGSGSNQTYRVTATILPASYQNALASTYADSLTITVLP